MKSWSGFLKLGLASLSMPLLVQIFGGVAQGEVGCSLATLSGSYIVSAMGTDHDAVSAFSGIARYDGKGAFMLHIRFAGPSGEARQDSGVYSHLGDCEFEVVSNSGRSAHYFVDPSGDWFKYVMQTGGNVVGEARRTSAPVGTR